MSPERRAKPHHLYRLFDEDGALLYIGITCNLGRRLAEHRRDARTNPLCPHFEAARRLHHWTSVEYPTRPEALVAERAAIRTEHPLFNINHRSAA